MHVFIDPAQVKNRCYKKVTHYNLPKIVIKISRVTK
jgi:hypothetical protein